MFELFEKLPVSAKIALAVVAALIVLAVLAPLIKLIVDILFVLLGLAIVFGGGYMLLTKTGILK